LGLNDTKSRNIPTLINALSRRSVCKIAIGDGFSIMLGKDVSAEE
jgi:hypothetical protein